MKLLIGWICAKSILFNNNLAKFWNRIGLINYLIFWHFVDVGKIFNLWQSNQILKWHWRPEFFARDSNSAWLFFKLCQISKAKSEWYSIMATVLNFWCLYWNKWLRHLNNEKIITYNIPSALIISGNFFECISKTY
jgi:hypothetical protein